MTKFQKCIQEFNSQYDGITVLQNLAQQFKIDQRFCQYGMSIVGEFFQKNDSDNLPDANNHNGQIDKGIDFLLSNRPNFAIIDKGISIEEHSCIWVENGHFYGMGYIPTDAVFTESSEIKDCVTPYRSNQYIMHLIYAYAQKYPGKVKRFQTNEA